MKWFSKNANPTESGFYYVRQERNIGVRYFDNSTVSWWLISAKGPAPNDSFIEWLHVEGVSNRQRS